MQRYIDKCISPSERKACTCVTFFIFLMTPAPGHPENICNGTLANEFH